MNIHEYQAKALLKAYGAPVAAGHVASTPEEAVAAARKLKGESFVVKAQIHAGGRGKGGGIKLVKELEELRGEAVSVTLNDAPPDATVKLPGYPEPQPNDLVIHQQDLQAVVNALWQGGAKGIKVMDQRLISTSAVRCVGNTLILQGRVYSPPYKVTAVGDPEQLQKALSASPEIQNYMLYVNAYGLGWKVEEDGAVTLPGYSGTVDLHYARPAE